MQLIQMRQQIKAVESIKKITQAMRLISMSTHTQLSHQTAHLQEFKIELSKILSIVQSADQKLLNSYLSQKNSNGKDLAILIGSQKGLAGTFNTILFKKFEKEVKAYKNVDFITVGKRATDYLKKKQNPIKTFDQFSLKNLPIIRQELFEIINSNYKNVRIFSNFSKSFFNQVPQETVLLPLAPSGEQATVDTSKYIWEQSAQEIFDELMDQYLEFSLQSILMNSLLSEQAARFQSMDSATNNAKELLDTIKLQYNKLRQARITSEITELSSSTTY